MFLNLVLEEQFSVRDQMVSSPEGSVLFDTGVIWPFFQYAPCYLSCNIYFLSNLLWCPCTSNLSTSQSAVCGWSVTKIDEGHSGTEGKGQGGLSVSAPPPPSIHPSILPSFPSIRPADKQWRRTEAFSDQHGQMDNTLCKRGREKKKEGKLRRREIWWEMEFDWNLWIEKCGGLANSLFH